MFKDCDFLVISSHASSRWIGKLKEALNGFGNLRIISARDIPKAKLTFQGEAVIVDGSSDKSAGLIKEVSSWRRSLRVLMAAGTSSVEKTVEAHRAGASEVIMKNTSAREIVSSVIGPRVLLADNNKDFLETRARALRSEGIEVVTAENPEQARIRLGEGKLDLAIVDVRLSKDSDRHDMSGLRVLGECERTISRLVLTGFPAPKIARQALRSSRYQTAAADEFLDKQETIRVFLGTVRRIIGRFRRRARATDATPRDVGDSDMEALVARLVEDQFKKISDGPTLDNYSGLVCVKVDNLSPETLSSLDGSRPVTTETHCLSVWFDGNLPTDLECIFSERIEILGGNDSDNVVFEVRLDGESIVSKKSTDTVVVNPRSGSKRLEFPFGFADDARDREVWIQVFQKNRLIQVVALPQISNEA